VESFNFYHSHWVRFGFLALALCSCANPASDPRKFKGSSTAETLVSGTLTIDTPVDHQAATGNIFISGHCDSGATLKLSWQNQAAYPGCVNGVYTSTILPEAFSKSGPLVTTVEEQLAGLDPVRITRTIDLTVQPSDRPASFDENAMDKIYVAPGGNDSNSGTDIQSPLATLAKARDVAASLVANPKSRGVVVYLRDGWYTLFAPVRFGPEHSGRPEAPIVFKNYGKENPVISGAIIFNNGADGVSWSDADINTVSGVKRVKSFRFGASLSNVLRQFIDSIKSSNNNSGKFAIPQMLVSGARKTWARHPDVAGVADTSRLSGTGPTPVIGVPANLVNNPTLVTDGKTEMVFTKLWESPRAIIQSHLNTNSNGTAFYQLALDLAFVTSAYWGGQPEKFYMDNNLAFLDQPGEWFLDETNLVLYYFPTMSDDLSKDSIVLPIAYTLIQLGDRGASQPVHDLIFDGLHFEFTNWRYTNAKGTSAYYSFGQAAYGLEGLFDGENVDRIVIQNSSIDHFGGNGISFGGLHGDPSVNAHQDIGRATNIVIYNNLFRDGGGSAIRIDNSLRPDSNNRIISNQISWMGTVFWDAPGITVMNTSQTSVNFNTLDHISYSGMSFGFGCRFSYLDQNEILSNSIFASMMNLVDGGGIYIATANGVAAKNHIEGTGAYRTADASPLLNNYHPTDLYFDSYVSFWKALDNFAALISRKTNLLVLQRNVGVNNAAATVLPDQIPPGSPTSEMNCPSDANGDPWPQGASGPRQPSWW